MCLCNRWASFSLEWTHREARSFLVMWRRCVIIKLPISKADALFLTHMHLLCSVPLCREIVGFFFFVMGTRMNGKTQFHPFYCEIMFSSPEKQCKSLFSDKRFCSATTEVFIIINCPCLVYQASNNIGVFSYHQSSRMNSDWEKTATHTKFSTPSCHLTGSIDVIFGKYWLFYRIEGSLNQNNSNIFSCFIVITAIVASHCWKLGKKRTEK